MKKEVQYWLNIAEYDIETAEAMLKSGRYLYVLFICQQAIEKVLKALIVQETEQLPPRVHDLLKLAGLAKVDVTDEEKEFLNKLSFYYLETRYPEQISDLSQSVDNDMGESYLVGSKEMLNWLKTKIV